ncbi:hypothetical protein B0W48_01845 [Pseudoalteromonas aliena]|uniref:DUF4139 domain-containing protein n=1 Tax=Pseudoalteromonas aliena TaxID=247523 RepID=A0A1Q2GUH2_9GAMM|nr:hypothetical protein [Pseudoalteromonas aliena]AQP98650.1 hypothetical protein B0W48_01845 [Pseudoalteromonas aliena]
MKKLSVPLIILFGASFQSLALNEEPHINKYSQTKNVEFVLNSVHKSTLETIIQIANSDKRLDAENENGLKDTFGDLSRKIPYSGVEILNINLSFGEIASTNISLKPTNLTYGRDLKLRSVEFVSQDKNLKARLYSFPEINDSVQPSELYYEFIVSANGTEKFFRLSKDWEVTKATLTKQMKKPSLSGNHTIEVRDGLIDKNLVAAVVNSGVSKSINGWSVKMPLDPKKISRKYNRSWRLVVNTSKHS